LRLGSQRKAKRQGQ